MRVTDLPKIPYPKSDQEDMFTRSVCSECDMPIWSIEVAYAVLLYMMAFNGRLPTASRKYLFCSSCAPDGLVRCTKEVTKQGNGITVMQVFRTFGSAVPVTVQ